MNTISFGRYVSFWFHRTPRRVLHSQCYYKFAAHLIGSEKRVLDVGCNEGLGTYLLGKECGYAKGIDFDETAIAAATANFACEQVEFEEADVLTMALEQIYDAVTSFDVIEHIYPEHVSEFYQALKASITPDGLAILGTPSLVSQQFASHVSRTGHVNIYAPDRLEAEMKEHFRHVFLFSCNDELIHTGFAPLAHYLLVVGAGKL